jgi:branched-chain amino acid transport system substrate-binding protein
METLISSVVKAIAPIGARQQVPIMNVGGSSPDLVNLNPYSFTLLPTGQNQANIMVPFAAKNMNLKTWSIVYSTDALGQGFVPVLKSLLQQSGGRVVGTVAVDPDASDYSSIVPALRSQNAQAIFLGTSNGATVPTLVDQIRGGQVHGAFVAYNGTPTPDLYKDPRAEGMVYTAQDLDLSPDATDKATADYVKAFKATYPNQELFDYAANDYNAVWVLAYAIKHLEATHQDVTGANVRKAMHDASPYTLVGGQTKLLSNNTLDMPLVIKKITHGAAVTLPDQG